MTWGTDETSLHLLGIKLCHTDTDSVSLQKRERRREDGKEARKKGRREKRREGEKEKK